MLCISALLFITDVLDTVEFPTLVWFYCVHAQKIVKQHNKKTRTIDGLTKLLFLTALNFKMYI